MQLVCSKFSDDVTLDTVLCCVLLVADAFHNCKQFCLPAILSML